jgi:hypothetical protein
MEELRTGWLYARTMLMRAQFAFVIGDFVSLFVPSATERMKFIARGPYDKKLLPGSTNIPCARYPVILLNQVLDKIFIVSVIGLKHVPLILCLL